MFDLDSPFEIRDDIEILKRMGLAFGLENGVCGPEVGRRLVGQCGAALAVGRMRHETQPWMAAASTMCPPLSFMVFPMSL